MMVIIMVTVILRYMVMKEEIQYYFLPITMVLDPDFSIAMHYGINVKLIFLNSVFIFEFV